MKVSSFGSCFVKKNELLDLMMGLYSLYIHYNVVYINTYTIQLIAKKLLAMGTFPAHGSAITTGQFGQDGWSTVCGVSEAVADQSRSLLLYCKSRWA